MHGASIVEVCAISNVNRSAVGAMSRLRLCRRAMKTDEETEPLDDEQRANVADALRMSRTIEREHYDNWILFPLEQAALED